jgi:hypothetical protein
MAARRPTALGHVEAPAVVERRSEVQAIAGARNGDIQQALEFLPVPICSVLVGGRAERSHRDGDLLVVFNGRHANRVATASSTAPEVHQEHDRELEPFGRVHGHQFTESTASTAAADSSPADRRSR